MEQIYLQQNANCQRGMTNYRIDLIGLTASTALELPHRPDLPHWTYSIDRIDGFGVTTSAGSIASDILNKARRSWKPLL